MRGLPYFEEEEYHQFLLSEERKELFSPERILSQIDFKGVKNLLDFGMGNGFFLPYFYKFIDSDCHVWGAESQEQLIDYTLGLKIRENFPNFTPFYIERTEHPLLPDWIPEIDLIFCSCVLSTFADPALALKGIGRGLSEYGRIIILDWNKVESPVGPQLNQKVSEERMKYFIDDAGYLVERNYKTGKYLYAMELRRDYSRSEEETHHVQTDL